MARTLPSTHFNRLVIGLAWLLAIAVVALVVRELTERALQRPVPLATDERNSDPRTAARQIGFRLSADEVPVVMRTEVAASAPVAFTELKLSGVATGFGDAPGFALFTTASGDTVAAALGERLPSGAVLRAIGADHVVLDWQGGETTLSLPRHSDSTTSR